MMILVSHQPVAVVINTPDCFISYKEGVLRENDCDCSTNAYFGADVDQSAIVVGYSQDLYTPGC